jgi:hypothetical protein
MNAEHDYILLYRTLVEKKFQLGAGEGKLKQRELEYIGQQVEQKSNIKLSISTLKRLWRNDVNQVPHPSTLDALVSILDYKDWQDFKKRNAIEIEANNGQVSSPAQSILVRSVPIFVVAGGVLMLALFVILFGFNKKNPGVEISGPIEFRADKMISSGVPNTVMFHYDLSSVKADSFFVQQSWNPRDKTRIDPANNYYSVTYYTPGFHFARIMANDSILKFANIHIRTDGWLPLIKYDLRERKPLYLDPQRILSDGFLGVDENLLKDANVDASRDFFLRYYNIRDFEGVDSDNFDLETRVRCDKLSDNTVTSTPCPSFELILITEEDVFFLPLTSKGCIGELRLGVGDVYKEGKIHDLSAFGIEDPYQWQILRIKNENKRATIFVNGAPAHEVNYSKSFGKIKGMIFTFTGSGSIDYVRLMDLKGNSVYSDEFAQ